MYNYPEDLADLEQAVREAIEAIPRYQPGLLSPDPAGCVQLYVMQPTDDSELGDFIFAACPYQFYLTMRGCEALGGGPAASEAIRGIFPTHQAAQALELGYSLLKQARAAQ